MKVSIITVARNSRKTIRDTIESVLNQTYDQIEYLIIDGQSSDGTVEIAREYEGKFKKRGFEYQCLSEEDFGIYDAMNKGIRISSGDIIGILNSDDWYANDAVSNIVNVFSRDPGVQFVHGAMSKVSFDKRILKVVGRRKSYWHFIEKAPYNHPTCFVRREIYKDIGLFDPRHKTAADYDFMLKIYHNSNIKKCYLDHVITYFREGGVTSNNLSVRVWQIFGILRNFGYSKFMIIFSLVFRFLRNLLARLKRCIFEN